MVGLVIVAAPRLFFLSPLLPQGRSQDRCRLLSNRMVSLTEGLIGLLLLSETSSGFHASSRAILHSGHRRGAGFANGLGNMGFKRSSSHLLAPSTSPTWLDEKGRAAAPPPPPPPPPPLKALLRHRGGALLLPALDPSVVKAAFGAVGELLVACGIGASAARTGIIDKTVLSSLSRVVYNILLPALLVVNVARTVYSKSLLSVLPLPLLGVVQVALCMGLSRVMIRVLGLDPNSMAGREIGVCCTYGNSGVLPILFSTVLLRNSPDPTAVSQAVSYVSLYLLGWSPLFWTLGYSQLSGPKKAVTATTSEVIAVAAAGDGSAVAPTTTTGSGLGERVKRFIKDPPAPLSRIFSPPIVGSLLGLLIGVSPLARLFLGKGAPFTLVTNAVETLSKAYSPVALLVLAGSLGLPTGKVDRGKDELSPVVEVASISFVRFLLCPLVFISLITKLRSSGLVTLDKLMFFVLFLESAMPSAQNTVIIHSLEGRPEAGTRLARILLWIYVMSALPISILLSLFLQKVPLT